LALAKNVEQSSYSAMLNIGQRGIPEFVETGIGENS